MPATSDATTTDPLTASTVAASPVIATSTNSSNSPDVSIAEEKRVRIQPASTPSTVDATTIWRKAVSIWETPVASGPAPITNGNVTPNNAATTTFVTPTLVRR